MLKSSMNAISLLPFGASDEAVACNLDSITTLNLSAVVCALRPNCTDAYFPNLPST